MPQAAIEALRESSAEGADLIDVVSCDRSEVAEQIKDAHVAVPLMTRLDDAMLSHAKERMVISSGWVSRASTSRRALRERFPVLHPLRAHGKRRLHRGDGRVPSPRGVSPRQPDGRLDPDRHSRRPLGQVHLGQQGAGRRLGNVGEKGGKAPQSLRVQTVHGVAGRRSRSDHPAALAEPSGNYASVDAALENNPGFDAVVLACNQTAETPAWWIADHESAEGIDVPW